jgi:hypothetical protein
MSGPRSASEVSSLTASDRGSLPSDGEMSPVVKRDSVVQRFNVQRSLCINGKYQNPWPSWRPPTFTNILRFGLARDKSNIPTKQVRFLSNIQFFFQIFYLNFGIFCLKIILKFLMMCSMFASYNKIVKLFSFKSKQN